MYNKNHNKGVESIYFSIFLQFIYLHIFTGRSVYTHVQYIKTDRSIDGWIDGWTDR